MTEITSDKKKIAMMAAKAFSGIPDVVRYWDDNKNNFVDLLTCNDQPQIGVSSYSTIGVSDVTNLVGKKAIDIRVELVGACSSSVIEFPNILSTAAFCIINSAWSCYPGAIFPNIISMYKCSKTMQHLLFSSPFLWENKLKTLEFKERKLAWLLAIPISEEELKYAEINGVDQLERLFEVHQIDIFNIERSSVV
ncbi:suppressor of fused domain protein [Acinetobacter sp. VNK23]|uniref:suppressor of fused domain protein n=1 Tax=Acinetobacter thutiue TaxID=2998078 RepID=UPI002577F4C5|nr:suppressor of fused domain protein [Acinetobacter thutiue]MDM1022143.1 suppressor of fused domain protein [Acinetobacter thutiue]